MRRLSSKISIGGVKLSFRFSNANKHLQVLSLGDSYLKFVYLLFNFKRNWI